MKEFLLLVILLFTISTLSSVESLTLSSFSIDLIHRDSPLSPFYNSSISSSELTRTAALRSISRINGLRPSSGDEKEAVESVIIPNGGDYLMKIFIGTPAVESLAIADTGSDLIWVQCLPCVQCYQQNAPIFDPKRSSSYNVISCDSQSCASLQNTHACGGSRECRYYYSYGDESFTVGELASETISLGSSNGPGAANNFPNTLFGCGHDNNGKFTSTSTGLVGLGGGPLSLVSQLGSQIGHKFSYCLLPSSSKSTSKLKFGTEATIPKENGVVSTPLISKSPSTYYYLNLEGATIGGKNVKNDDNSNGNIIIDSGTTLTFFKTNFYESFESAVREAIGNDHQPVQDPPEPFSLCYKDDGSVRTPSEMMFHFAGADLNLKRMNIFTELENNLVCMLVVPSERFSIFGNLAQVNFEVEYDLQGKMVSFAPADCTKQ